MGSKPTPLREYVESRCTPEPNSGCWLWELCPGSHGYGNAHRVGFATTAHRASYEAFVGPVDADLKVCHRCDNPLCVNPDHLFLGDHQTNMDDMVRKGRARGLKGEESRSHKLSQAQAIEVRRRARCGTETQFVIADAFGISQGAVSNIKTGRNWAHLPAPETEESP